MLKASRAQLLLVSQSPPRASPSRSKGRAPIIMGQCQSMARQLIPIPMLSQLIPTPTPSQQTQTPMRSQQKQTPMPSQQMLTPTQRSQVQVNRLQRDQHLLPRRGGRHRGKRRLEHLVQHQQTRRHRQRPHLEAHQCRRRSQLQFEALHPEADFVVHALQLQDWKYLLLRMQDLRRRSCFD